MIDFFRTIFGIEKSPEQIRKEIEENNEQNYIDHKFKVLKQSEEYKEKYKDIIEYHTKKLINQVTLKELIELGFNSPNLTKKHCEEIFV